MRESEEYKNTKEPAAPKQKQTLPLKQRKKKTATEETSRERSPNQRKKTLPRKQPKEQTVESNLSALLFAVIAERKSHLGELMGGLRILVIQPLLNLGSACFGKLGLESAFPCPCVLSFDIFPPIGERSIESEG
jgi:uncharacterized membrane protein